MMRYTRDTVLLLALCASFAGCAGDTKGSEDTAAAMSAARSDRAATAGALDACALVQKAEVDAAFAPRVFGNGEKGASDMAGTDRLAAVSTCTFTSTGPSARELMTVSIFVRRAPSDAMGVSLATAKEGAVKLNAPPPVDVSGLGDSAYWINLGSSSLPNIQLNVFKGQRVWFIFSATTRRLETDTALSGLTKVAEASLGRF